MAELLEAVFSIRDTLNYANLVEIVSVGNAFLSIFELESDTNSKEAFDCEICLRRLSWVRSVYR